MSLATSTNPTGTDLKDNLLKVIGDFLANSSDTGDDRDAVTKRLAPVQAVLQRNLFELVVMGEIKKGKTSFLTALVGASGLLPVDDDIATSTVYKLLYGPSLKVTIFFNESDDPATPTREPLPIAPEAIAEFGTEAGNPQNEKNVDFISVELPHELLKAGLVIVDTPGLGGLYKNHRFITIKYAPKADVVFFITDSVESPIKADEINFIRHVSKYAQLFVFIQTKSDMVSADQIEAYRLRNLDILSRALGVPTGEIPYFVVSSKMKANADRTGDVQSLKYSNFQPVDAFTRQVLIPHRDALLVQKWAPVVAAEIHSACRDLSERLDIAKNAGNPKLAEYEAALQSVEQELKDWQTQTWPKRQRTFKETVGKVVRSTRHEIQDTFSNVSGAAERASSDFASSHDTIDAINSDADDMLRAYAAARVEQGEVILGQFKQSYCTAYENTVQEGIADLNAITIPSIEASSGAFQGQDPSMAPALREAYLGSIWVSRAATMGQMALGGAAGVAVMLGLISNPIGLTIAIAASLGAVATKVWSVVTGYKRGRERQVAQAIAGVRSAVQNNIDGATQRAVGRAFEELGAELESEASNGFADLSEQVRLKTNSRREQLRLAKSRTEDETKQAVASLGGRLKYVAELGERLRAMLPRRAQV